MNRRSFLRVAGAAAAGVVWPPPIARAEDDLDLGPPRPFAHADLVERARRLAAEDFAPRESAAPDVVEKIDYDAHGKIRYRRSQALFADGPGVYPVTLFPLGRYFPRPVEVHVVGDGRSREVRYSRRYFEMPEDSVARDLPDDVGFAGLRIHESRRRDDWKNQDWAAFLGASYFRTIGALGQYGISARGIAIDTAVASDEEFPEFVELYVEPALREGDPVIVHALLDGPSIVGAYRFAMTRTEGVVVDVDAAIFLRRRVERLGIAPLTSMYWFGERDRPLGVDWRPEVHDSDGLALWTGTGERLWRPLRNPTEPSVSAFLDADPRGFGLLQRDRELENYLDGVRYDLRPSLWVEPLGGWGPGAVELVELPTDDEIHDNIVAFWVPKETPEAGESRHFRYRLHWTDEEPYFPRRLARVVATRTGRGGEAGKPRPEGVRKFVVEFAGGPLVAWSRDVEPEAVVDSRRGEIAHVEVEPVPSTERWRAKFDLEAEDDGPVELRLFLRIGGRPLTETWVHRSSPERFG